MKKLRKSISELKELIDMTFSKRYRHWRNEDGDLICEHEGIKYKFPIITLRPYQKEISKALFEEGKKRFFLVRPRRSGKEVESWSLLIQAALTKPGLYLAIYPTNVRARLVLWDGAIFLNDNGESKSIKFIDMIPEKFVRSKNNTEMSLSLTNGSIIKCVGSDIDPDKLRGTNCMGAFFSEFAFSDPRVLHTLMPAFRQNGGWFILQTTFNGLNHAYKFFNEVKGNKFWVTRLDSVESLKNDRGERYITDDMIDEDRKAGMPEFLIQQEYYSVVTSNHEKLWFSEGIKHIMEEEQIIEGLYLNNKPVYCFADLGVNDSTAIIMAQFDNEMRPQIINYIEDNNKSLEYYIKQANYFVNKKQLHLKEWFLPHDGARRDICTARTPVQYFSELGEKATSIQRPSNKIDAIRAMRKLSFKSKFNKENTARLIDCLSNYSKVYDEKNNIYRNAPLHDWCSHGVDAFQSMTIALESALINTAPIDTFYYS